MVWGPKPTRSASRFSNTFTRFVTWRYSVSSRSTHWQPDLLFCPHFLGPYAAGILIGMQYEKALSLFWAYKKLLIVIAGLTTVALSAMYLSNYETRGPTSIRETLFYLQKLSLAALIVVNFRSCEGRLPRWLDSLGTHAFSIYLLHAVIQSILMRAEYRVLPHGLSAPILSTLGLGSLVVRVAGSVMLSVVAKRLLGTRSRMCWALD